MRAIRLLLRGLLWSGLLLLLLPLALTTALMTESGSSWLLRQTPDLVRPLGIQFSFNSSHGSLLGRLELKGVKITVADSRLEAARLLLQWRPLAIAGGTLHIQSLQLADAQLVLPVPVESAATAPEIPNIVLPIALQLDEFLLERLQIEQGETRLTVTRAALAAKFDAQGLVLRDLRYEGGGVQLEGAVSMQSTAPHNLVGEVSAIVDQALTGAEIGAIKARLELSGTALGPELDLKLSSPTTLRLRGSLKLDQLQPGFNLIAEWPELNWPLQGAATITTQTGRLELKGMVSDYQLELKTSVSGEGVPPADIELMAQGDAQGVKLQPLRIHSLDGELQVNGKVGWNETLNWELELLAERINPGLYLPEWPGRIDGRIEIDGALLTQPAGEIALQTRIHKLNGELRGQKISASGGLDYRAGEVRASKIELASGPNRIHLDGRADERLDLSFDIKAPQLATLYPGLSGRLEGAGRLKGTRQAPTVTAELKGYSVAYQDTLLQNIKLNLDWQESGGKGELRLTGLDAQGIQVSELSADLTGTPLSHSLKLEVRAAPYSVGLTAQGGLEARTWEGALARLTLDEPTLGEWRLQAPAKLRLSETLVRSEPLCMAQAATSLCAEGGWSKEKGVDIVGGLKDFQLARLAAHLPEAATIEGALRGEFKVSGASDQPAVEFQLQPSDG